MVPAIPGSMDVSGTFEVSRGLGSDGYDSGHVVYRLFDITDEGACNLVKLLQMEHLERDAPDCAWNRH